MQAHRKPLSHPSISEVVAQESPREGVIVRLDGRNARRQNNRQAVVESVIALLNEGVAVPTLEQIVTRAGVSERSLFRYFDGLEDLRSAVVAEVFEAIPHLFAVRAAAEGPLAERVRSLVDRRLRLFDQIGSVARLARARELEVPSTALRVQCFREELMAECAAQFHAELSRRTRAEAERVLTAVAVLLSFESWDMQTRGYGHSRTKVRRTWIGALETLLA